MRGTVKYIGRRRIIEMIEGFKKHVNPHDHLNLSLEDCKRLLETGRYRPIGSTALKLHDTFSPEVKNDNICNMMTDKPVFIVGRGESLKGFDYKKLRGHFTIAINQAFLNFRSDAVLFLDKVFVKNNREKLIDYTGLIFAANKTYYSDMDLRSNVYGFNSARKVSPNLLHGLYSHNLGGLAAVNLALIMGAQSIYLLGFDLNGGRCDNHRPFTDNYTRPEWTHKHIKAFRQFEEFKDRIYNCNKDSAIECFDYVNIDEVLS